MCSKTILYYSELFFFNSRETNIKRILISCFSFPVTQDYSSLHRVEVIVKASLHVDTTSKNTVLTNAETQVILCDTIVYTTQCSQNSKAELRLQMSRHCICFSQVKLTVFPERVEARSGGVPWWIIVLSILFALLLLALLAFLLWKVGLRDR